MHRTCGTVAIKDDILFVADFSGVFHCLDAKTGKAHWTYDMFAASWASPLIVENRVYISDEDGDIAIFEVSKEQRRSPKSIWKARSTLRLWPPIAPCISPIGTAFTRSPKAPNQQPSKAKSIRNALAAGKTTGCRFRS